MSLATDIQSALDGTKPESASECDSFLQTMADNVAAAVSNFLSSSSTSTSMYAGGSVAAAVGMKTSWSLDASILSAQLKAGFDATDGDNTPIATGFNNGVAAMISGGVLSESATGTTTSGNPISFTGTGNATGKSVPPDGIKSQLDSMQTVESSETDIRTAEVKRLKIMAESFADAVAQAFPATTAMSGAGATGTGTVTLTSPVK